MHERKTQKTPEHTSEYVKSQNFLEACPQPPLMQSILWVPLFIFALGPLNPVGASSQQKIKGINNLKKTAREWNSVVNQLRPQTALSARNEALFYKLISSEE